MTKPDTDPGFGPTLGYPKPATSTKPSCGGKAKAQAKGAFRPAAKKDDQNSDDDSDSKCPPTLQFINTWLSQVLTSVDKLSCDPLAQAQG
jgi:hypothetical protein